MVEPSATLFIMANGAMFDQAEITVREVQYEIGVIFSFLKSSNPDRNKQAGSDLADLIERLFADPITTRTKAGAETCDVLIRARENLRIDCVRDALVFLKEARELVANGWTAAGERAK
jgi:hypothetical protein